MTRLPHQPGSTSYRTVRRHMFGGMITADLPQAFIDASEFRQVPDNQEVLISSSSDTSIITEVLQSVKEGQAATDMEAAIRFHFDSLAHDNSAFSSSIDSVTFLDRSSFPVPPLLPDARLGPGGSDPRAPTPSPWILSGLQVVPKYGRTHDPPHVVRIHLALWRLQPTKDVDLVMTFNIPRQVVEPVPQPGTAQPSQVQSAPAGPAGPEISREEALTTELFHKAAASLTIEDWSLFG